jgi:deazaflavin-dependent oxidoreductase (nitroreductase family)
MSATAHARDRLANNRRLFGIRQPGRLALAVFRLPLPLYRRGWGWLLGRTFLLLVHAGRRTGTLHETTAMVLTFDETTKEAVICSAWGSNADWVRNIRARPAVRVQVGSDSFIPEQRFLPQEEAVAVAVDFRRRHPWRLRLFTSVLGWGELRSDAAIRDFVRQRPFVAFRPGNVAARTSSAAGLS